MSHSSMHALSTRLFIQAAVTGLLAPLTRGGSTWLVATLAVAAAAVGVAMLLRSNPANAKVTVVGFEAVAVAIGGVGIAGGHYIPGTIIGVATLITALNMHAVPPASQASEWVPPQDADQAAGPAAPGPDPRFAAPEMSAPVMDNPYAPPPTVSAQLAPAPVMAPPVPVVPVQAVAPEGAARSLT